MNSAVRQRLEDLAIYVSYDDRHASDTVALHRERTSETLWMALNEIDSLRRKLEVMNDG